MRAVVIEDGAVRFVERPDPVPAAGELLVAVASAGINGADLLQRAGHYPPPAGIPPDIPGLECCGTVVAAPATASRFVAGDRVMGLVGGAGQAELVVLHERVAIRVPEGVPSEVAGGFCETFATAHDALFTQGRLAMGDRLLVNGAAGGVGVAAVQLALAAGADVVASVRDPAARERVAALGCLAVAPGDVARHGPYDVELELVGSPNLAEDVELMASGGRLVVIGLGGGASAELDLRLLMQRRGTISSSTLRARPLEDKAAVVRRLEHHVVPLLASGRITVPVEARFPFAQVEDAYERFAAGSKFGKIVLVATS